MKCLLVNTYDVSGGAAKAALRLYGGLRRHGVSARLLVRSKALRYEEGIDGAAFWRGRMRAYLNLLPCKLYPRRQLHNFSANWLADGLSRRWRAYSPDLVHLHWVGDGFLHPQTLCRFTGPIVWTLHDSWAFTGGCHLPGECRAYECACGRCPILGSTIARDLSRRGWLKKRYGYPTGRMTLIAPSRWMAQRVQCSSLLRDCAVKVIPNGIDVESYTPGDRAAARERLGLPQTRRLILFGAHHALSDRNKGFDLLCDIVRRLPAELRAQSTLVIFGESARTPLPNLGMDTVNRGEIGDEAEVIALYQSADLLLVCSRQENLPNMISESMACGLPCAAFSVGGIPDQIIHHENGCLVPAFDNGAMATEIAWLLENGGPHSKLVQSARKRAVESFSLEQVVKQHLELYCRLVETVQNV